MSQFMAIFANFSLSVTM